MLRNDCRDQLWHRKKSIVASFQWLFTFISIYLCLFRHFYHEIMGTTIMSITITSAKKKIFEVHNIAISSRNHIRADIDLIVSLFSNLDLDRKVCQVCVESKNQYSSQQPSVLCIQSTVPIKFTPIDCYFNLTVRQKQSLWLDRWARYRPGFIQSQGTILQSSTEILVRGSISNFIILYTFLSSTAIIHEVLLADWKYILHWWLLLGQTKESIGSIKV